METINTSESKYLTLNEMAEALGVELDAERSRILSGAINYINKRQQLPTTTRRVRTAKPPVKPSTSELKRTTRYQSYLVTAYSPQMQYYFTQLCTLLDIYK